MSIAQYQAKPRATHCHLPSGTYISHPLHVATESHTQDNSLLKTLMMSTWTTLQHTLLIEPLHNKTDRYRYKRVFNMECDDDKALLASMQTLESSFHEMHFKVKHHVDPNAIFKRFLHTETVNGKITTFMYVHVAPLLTIYKYKSLQQKDKHRLFSQTEDATTFDSSSVLSAAKVADLQQGASFRDYVTMKHIWMGKAGGSYGVTFEADAFDVLTI